MYIFACTMSTWAVFLFFLSVPGLLGLSMSWICYHCCYYFYLCTIKPNKFIFEIVTDVFKKNGRTRGSALGSAHAPCSPCPPGRWSPFLSLSLFLTVSLSRSLWEKPKQEESGIRGEEEEDTFFFRYSGGARIFRKRKKNVPNLPVRSSRRRKSPHGCASESAADTALRTLLMPRLWVYVRLQERGWTRGGGGRGWGACCFQFDPPVRAPVSGGAFARSAALRERSVSSTPSPSPPLPSFLPFSSLLSFLTPLIHSCEQAVRLWGKSGGEVGDQTLLFCLFCSISTLLSVTLNPEVLVLSLCWCFFPFFFLFL